MQEIPYTGDKRGSLADLGAGWHPEVSHCPPWAVRTKGAGASAKLVTAGNGPRDAQVLTLHGQQGLCGVTRLRGQLILGYSGGRSPLPRFLVRGRQEGRSRESEVTTSRGQGDGTPRQGTRAAAGRPQAAPEPPEGRPPCPHPDSSRVRFTSDF